MTVRRKRRTICHVTRNDDEVVVLCVREYVFLVVCSLSDSVSDMDSEDIFLVKIRFHFRVYIFVEKKSPRDISGRVGFDALGAVDRLPERLHHFATFGFDVAHLTRVVVVVGKRTVDVGHVQVVSIGNSFRVDILLFDERVHLPDADAMAGDIPISTTCCRKTVRP